MNEIIGSIWERKYPSEDSPEWNRVIVKGYFAGPGELSLQGLDAFTETISAPVEALQVAYTLTGHAESGKIMAEVDDARARLEQLG